MKQTEILNFSKTTLKPSKTLEFHPKIPKMERCDLSNFPPLKIIGLTSKNIKKSTGLVKQAEAGISNVKIRMPKEIRNQKTKPISRYFHPKS